MFVARRVPGRNLHPTSYKSRQFCVMLESVSHMRIFLLTEMRLQVELTFGRNGTVPAYEKLELLRSAGSVKQVKSVRDCMERQALNASHALAKHCSDAVKYFS